MENWTKEMQIPTWDPQATLSYTDHITVYNILVSILIRSQVDANA